MDKKTDSVFSFDNVFNRFPVITPGVKTHDSLKSLSLYGTFLENTDMMNNYQAAGYNVIEMESGPYVAAIYRHFHPEKALSDAVYEISSLPFELGIINYASDNPLVQNLGDTPLAFRGIEPTYAATSAVISRIVALENAVVSGS